jgi:hypothetical protein
LVFSFFERNKIIKPLIKAMIIGATDSLNKGVAARITATIADVKPKIMNDFFIFS